MPELAKIPVTDILRWEKDTVRKKYKGVYLDPVVDHALSAKTGKEMLKQETVPW